MIPFPSLFIAGVISADAAWIEDTVIVVGGGLAGLSATLEAAKHDCTKVVLIDSEKALGGNSAKASSGKMYVFGNVALARESAGAIEFLEKAGVDLGDVTLCGGHSLARTHRIPSTTDGMPQPVGFGIVTALKKKIESIQKKDPSRIKILLNSRVLGLISWNDSTITGVICDNSSLLAEFAGAELRLPTTNGPFARGDGVKMARHIGAKLIGMNRVQVHPTAFVDPADPGAFTKFLAAEALRGKGALLLSSKGVRFANELDRRDYVTARIQQECAPLPATFHGGSAGQPAALLVMNDRAIDDFGRPAFNFYAVTKKFFVKYANAVAFAAALGIDAAVKKTYAHYLQRVCGQGLSVKTASKRPAKDAFNKTIFPVAFNEAAPIHVALITPAIHYTMGGLQINKRAEVFNGLTNKSFTGLFAAGEVAGGVYGANRLCGNSLLECVVFGRIAGKTAAFGC